MSHESLYRQARPRKFSDVVGQEAAVAALERAVVEGKVPTAMLLSGMYGCGKTTLARLVAAAVNCHFREEGSADPCGGSNPDCNTCPGVIDGTPGMGSVIEIDGAHKNSVADVRDLIASLTVKGPSDFTVYIVDEAHHLSRDAATTMLKTIEEPPPGVIFILATTAPESLNPALRSRLVQYALTPLSSDQVRAIVREAAERFETGLGEDAIERIVDEAQGSGRNALSLLERYTQGAVESEDSASFLRAVTDALADRDRAGVVVAVAQRLSAGDSVVGVHGLLLNHFHRAVIAQRAPEALTVRGHAAEEAEYAAGALDETSLLRLTERLASLAVGTTPNAHVLLDVTLLSAIGAPGGDAGVPQIDTADLLDQIGRLLDTKLAALPLVAPSAPAAHEPPSLPAAPDEVAGDEDLAQTEDEISQPLPEPERASDDEDDDVAPSEFDAEAFMNAITSSPDLSRAGRLRVERKATLGVHSKKANTVVLEMGRDQSLGDDDWNAVVAAVKQMGWEIDERLV